MFGSQVETAYLCIRNRERCFSEYFGALVQLVRIHACHAWGHGFESRTHRTFQTKNPLVSSKSEDFLFGR